MPIELLAALALPKRPGTIPFCQTSDQTWARIPMDIRPLTSADIPFGLRLCAQNQWNQLAADWQRQLDLEPAGCFLALEAGQPVGTACCCVFGDVAWINMVLVDRTYRGQGVGSALMRHVVQCLEERGVLSIRLDATALGQPVYEKLGFVGEFTLTRFAGVLPTTPFAVSGIEPLTTADLPTVYALDHAVTQTRRETLLRLLFDAAPDTMRKYALGGRLEGFCLTRPGANAWHMGPIHGSPEACRHLFLDAANRFAGHSVYVDVPSDHVQAVRLAQSLALKPQRTLLRMGRGKRVWEDLPRFWSGFGPEKG
jgi:GNAT superfamily N-acetyltransferase